eukprot:scaffold211079_cov25-Tisochrysis_lutea.AAC.5
MDTDERDWNRLGDRSGGGRADIPEPEGVCVAGAVRPPSATSAPGAVLAVSSPPIGKAAGVPCSWLRRDGGLNGRAVVAAPRLLRNVKGAVGSGEIAIAMSGTRLRYRDAVAPCWRAMLWAMACGAIAAAPSAAASHASARACTAGLVGLLGSEPKVRSRAPICRRSELAGDAAGFVRLLGESGDRREPIPEPLGPGVGVPLVSTNGVPVPESDAMLASQLLKHKTPAPLGPTVRAACRVAR